MENIDSDTKPLVSILVVSFNTKGLLKRCLEELLNEVNDVPSEIIVVDNASKDGSADMVTEAFPEVKLIRSPVNLGFAAANNLGFKACEGKFIVLLNSDAFIRSGGLKIALDKIQKDPWVGLGGAKLVGEDDAWQPSFRQFPSLWNEFLQLSGLADRFPQSKFFGKYNHTCDDQNKSTETDWVPGAFAIMPRQVIEKIGFFDEQFFLYYEEVDLCKRIQQAGFKIAYWPEVVVTHLGGASAMTVLQQSVTSKANQLVLWSFRSQFLYYRKHHGRCYAWLVYRFQVLWHALRKLKNWAHADKREESDRWQALIRQAWVDTQGGAVSPDRPWKLM